MSADLIQAKYDELDSIAKRFQSESEAQQQLLQQVKAAVNNLQQGGWEGEGATAFFAEMDSEIFPTMQRLDAALESASSVTLNVSQIIRDAEEEAAALFQGDGINLPFNGGPPLTNMPPPGANGGPTIAIPLGPMPLPTPKQEGIWDKLKTGGDIYKFDRKKGGKFDPGLNVMYELAEGSVWGDPSKSDSSSALGYTIEAGVKVDGDGVMIGVGGEIYAAQGSYDTVFIGDSEYGLTGEIGYEVAKADAFIGARFNEDGFDVGGTVGVNLVSAKGEIGTNIAGFNVGVTGEVGLKAELGFSLSDEGVEIKAPFFSIGFSFGKGKD